MTRPPPNETIPAFVHAQSENNEKGFLLTNDACSKHTVCHKFLVIGIKKLVNGQRNRRENTAALLCSRNISNDQGVILRVRKICFGTNNHQVVKERGRHVVGGWARCDLHSRRCVINVEVRLLTKQRSTACYKKESIDRKEARCTSTEISKTGNDRSYVSGEDVHLIYTTKVKLSNVHIRAIALDTVFWTNVSDINVGESFWLIAEA